MATVGVPRWLDMALPLAVSASVAGLLVVTACLALR